MSLCNTFRLFVVSLIIVLSTIDTPAAFTLHRTTSGEPSRDLAKEHSVVLEIKHDKSQVPAQNVVSHENNSDILEPNKFGTTKSDSNKTTASNTTQSPNLFVENQVSSSDSIIYLQTNDESTTVIVMEKEEKTTTDISATTDPNETKKGTNSRQNKFSQSESTTETTLGEMVTETTLKFDDFELTTAFESERIPLKKKYTTIDRKRQPIAKNVLKSRNKKTGEINKSETKQSKVTLQDTVTPDIPSLEKFKNDLLYSTSKEEFLEVKDELLKSLTTDINDSLEMTTSIVEPTVELSSSTRWETVASKRAGYLDLSAKVNNQETLTAKETSDFKQTPKGLLRGIFDIGNVQSDIPDEGTENAAKSQGQLNDDTIVEELLKEKVINENQDNTKEADIKSQGVTEISNNNEQHQEFNSSIDEQLSVKPISSDKIKNISLYSVSPNYKPLKKIEVQPPKQFVRDPDDNTWRNESLNSLGIVFKSKNSSKPFTQVLKSKTEAELNSLTEKESKNDIPDLRERLQKMTEKRKSKRKKTDSMGNVVYFDYEENSGSRENNSKEEQFSTVKPLSETTTNINRTSNGSSETPALTTDSSRSKMRDLHSTKKFKNFFNIPEYYDTTEEDDADYLSMAKIDIKKFITSPKTTLTTHVTRPATQSRWGINRFSSTISPERKATIQYFPPLKTQKISINDYDNDFKFKVNSFTTNTEPPKQVLSVPLETPKPPDNTFQHKHPNSERENNFAFNPTQPPQNTQTALTLLNDDGSYDRDSYAIRHYKDFVNEAAKDNEFDKNLEYIPYTQSPEKAITKAELIKYVTEKAKVNMDQEYDDESQFRKDVLQRFVDNFNQNSERFKSDFPILFNNSIIHRDTQNGLDVASSRAFMRGLYNTDFKSKTPRKDSYDPNNENITVELSPSYELHYYVPEQEEKEEVVQPPVTLPYQYRL